MKLGYSNRIAADQTHYLYRLLSLLLRPHPRCCHPHHPLRIPARPSARISQRRLRNRRVLQRSRHLHRADHPLDARGESGGCCLETEPPARPTTSGEEGVCSLSPVDRGGPQPAEGLWDGWDVDGEFGRGVHVGGEIVCEEYLDHGYFLIIYLVIPSIYKQKTRE